MVSQIVARNWRTPGTNFERPVHDFVIEHKGSRTHRSTERCELCEKHAASAAPIFSPDEFTREQ